MGEKCLVCGELILEGKEVIKKHENLGEGARICQDCLSIPIKCIKTNITLNEILHRIRVLRGPH